MNMILLFSHPEWVEVPKKTLHRASSTAGKGPEVQLSTEMHAESIHSVTAWKWKILEPMYKLLKVIKKLPRRYREQEM